MSITQIIGTIGFVLIVGIPVLLVVIGISTAILRDHRKGDHEMLILLVGTISFTSLVLLFAMMMKGE